MGTGAAAERVAEVLTAYGPERVAGLENVEDGGLVVLVPEEGESPRAAVAAVVNRAPTASIVVVAAVETRARIRQAFDTGASGYVVAGRLDQTLVPTVEAVLAGQLCLPPESGLRHSPALSTREKQVLAMVVLGLSNGEIASKLYVTESTVKSHLTSAFGKLGVRSRNEATSMILDPHGPLGPGILTIPSSD